jgi:hypothetical protein
VSVCVCERERATVGDDVGAWKRHDGSSKRECVAFVVAFVLWQLVVGAVGAAVSMERVRVMARDRGSGWR